MSFNLPKTDKKRVVIVGGGFGGLKLANKLRKSNFQVVLIDRNNYHQFPPLIYQIASAGIEPSSISFPFRKLFQKRKNRLVPKGKLFSYHFKFVVVFAVCGQPQKQICGTEVVYPLSLESVELRLGILVKHFFEFVSVEAAVHFND